VSDIGLLLLAELLVLGVVGGFLAGLLGVGGGMMMVPFLTLILGNRGVPPGMAVKGAPPWPWPANSPRSYAARRSGSERIS